MNFEDAVQFHGHACPGLAIGYRVATLALKELGARARDEELVAIVENSSCAVDAIQLLCGTTFGKGNLVFRDYGKHVYTFISRTDPHAIRIAVKREAPTEEPEIETMWKRYVGGDRSPEVVAAVQDRKNRKMKLVLEAPDSELFQVEEVKVEMPAPARIFESRTCSRCGEKVMETRLRQAGGQQLCIPCSGRTAPAA
jgi:formylmethanofuran dehydrogenase subunit E